MAFARRLRLPLPLVPSPSKIGLMSTYPAGTTTLLSELAERLRKARQGVRDPEEMRKACDHMDQAREELRQRIGTVEVAVNLVREGREE